MTDVTRLDEPSGSLSVSARRGLMVLVWLVGVAAVLTVVAWVTTHPSKLPTSDDRVSASTPAGQTVFLGVFANPDDRTLHIAGVRIFATSTVDVEITPHLCRGGSVNVTTTPATFCSELVDTEGTTMGQGDEIVLEVAAEDAGTVDIDRIRVAYRDGLQWGTQDAGSRALVTILPR